MAVNRSQRLSRLATITRLVLDHRLAELRQAEAARTASVAQLSALSAPFPPADLPIVAAHRADLLWQQWADARRRDLNPLLARQTARWLEARAAAQTAIARDNVLAGLARTAATKKGGQLS